MSSYWSQENKMLILTGLDKCQHGFCFVHISITPFTLALLNIYTSGMMKQAYVVLVDEEFDKWHTFPLLFPYRSFLLGFRSLTRPCREGVWTFFEDERKNNGLITLVVVPERAGHLSDLLFHALQHGLCCVSSPVFCGSRKKLYFYLNMFYVSTDPAAALIFCNMCHVVIITWCTLQFKEVFTYTSCISCRIHPL